MYVTPKMANRWKEIHWLQIDRRCWEATYGPSTRESAHLREARNGDGEPWPEWMGEERSDHPDNEARERARKELELDITIPDYTEIVEATVSHRMSTATETIMAHLLLSAFIFLSHERQKAEQCSVGKESPLADRERADDYVRRVEDHRSRWPSTSEAALERTGARSLTWAVSLTTTQAGAIGTVPRTEE
jgi:hypothetical protein